MEQLEVQDLIDVSGGAGKDTVVIKVMVIWKGNAEKYKKQVTPIKVKCWDANGTAYGTVSNSNDWTCKFRVLNKANFETRIDVSAHPIITKVEKDWNQKANLMIYYFS